MNHVKNTLYATALVLAAACGESNVREHHLIKKDDFQTANYTVKFREYRIGKPLGNGPVEKHVELTGRRADVTPYTIDMVDSDSFTKGYDEGLVRFYPESQDAARLKRGHQITCTWGIGSGDVCDNDQRRSISDVVKQAFAERQAQLKSASK